jgi:23S rRNA pseudouridine2457 synthase
MPLRNRQPVQKGTRKSAFFVSAKLKRQQPKELIYVAFNKPFGVLSQFTTELGKRTLAEFKLPEKIYAIGRLDEESEGLLLLTNDDALKHQLTDPRFEHKKTYLVQVERVPSESALQQLRDGINVGGLQTRPADVRLLESEPNLIRRPVPIRFRKSVPTAWLRLTITEGKNRQVRRMTAAVGHPTLRLVRVQIAGLELGNIHPGEWKRISKDSILKK